MRVALSLLIASACTPDEPEPEPAEPRPLVEVEAWTPATEELPPEFVPLPDMRVSCKPVDGWGPWPFGGVIVFEINTGSCNWGTFEQPLLDDVVAGELVTPRLWHFELTSAFPAEGYAGVAIRDEIVWEYRVDIPSESALAADGFIAEEDIPAGTPIRFHVHNHGINSWYLVDVTAGPPDAE